MQVKMLRNPSQQVADCLGCKLTEGESGRLANSVAEKLIKLRLAEPIEEAPEPELNAIPPEPSVAEPAAAEISGPRRKRRKNK